MRGDALDLDARQAVAPPVAKERDQLGLRIGRRLIRSVCHGGRSFDQSAIRSGRTEHLRTETGEDPLPHRTAAAAA